MRRQNHGRFFTTLRVFTLLGVGLATTLSPCRAAFVAAPGCPMQGCHDSASLASYEPCCCDPPGVPADAAVSPVMPAASGGTVAPLPSTLTCCSSWAPGAPDGAPGLPAAVPLFILNASLLI